MKKFVVVLSVALLALTGCGENKDAKTAKAALSKSVLEQNSGDSPFDKKAADCFGDKVVDALGVEKLKKYGVLTDELAVNDSIDETKMSSSDAGKAADAIAACVDIEKFVAASTGAGEGDPEVAECLRETVDKEMFRAIMKATFEGDAEGLRKAAEPAQKCQNLGLPETPTP